jgi:hypothetical protein
MMFVNVQSTVESTVDSADQQDDNGRRLNMVPQTRYRFRNGYFEALAHCGISVSCLDEDVPEKLIKTQKYRTTIGGRSPSMSSTYCKLSQ